MLFRDGHRGITEDEFVQPIDKEGYIFILGNLFLAFEVLQPSLVSRYMLSLPGLIFPFDLNLWISEFGIGGILGTKVFPMGKQAQ